jgi:hypothetical protein
MLTAVRPNVETLSFQSTSGSRAAPTAVALAQSAARDARLDFWRALCLIDMVLVHLVYEGVNFGPISRTIAEYTRFAAGGFVFVAGLSIGAIFLPRALGDGGRSRVYPKLLRRSLYILCVHYAATLSFVALDLIRGMRTEAPPIFGLVRDIVLLREGGDLLPLYVILVAASVPMLEILRRRGGWLLLGAISVGLFAWGHHSPAALAFPMNQSFPVVLWQLMFTAGMLFGFVLPRYSALTRRVKMAMAVGAWSLSLLLWAGDFRSDFGWSFPSLPLVFCKTPLTTGEALRYFGLIFVVIFSTDLLWEYIDSSRVVALANDIGRRSLGTYVAHAWLVGLLGIVAHRTAAAGAWQMLLAIPAVWAMWVVAQMLSWFDSTRRRRGDSARSTAWRMVPAAVTAALLVFVTVGRVMRPHEPPRYKSDAAAADVASPPDSPVMPDFDSSDSTDIISV